ncbi:LicD family protein [Nocardioides rotundus]|uniref:LicD family protein n=1 Tax=Nocardioides rotundus TaxID=1774216 RepID=UPI001CBE3A64|nr:LicD family protein [Nocardioides rotundus]UAL30597.1 LicD family protein [Nocardioides rotundus]
MDRPRASAGLPEGVLRATLEPLFPVPAGQRIGGVLVRRGPVVAGEARVLVGATEVPVEWGLTSPRAGQRFPGAHDPGHSRFRATADPGLTGPARLVVRGPDGDDVVLATLDRPWAPADPGLDTLPAIAAAVDSWVESGERPEGGHERLLAGLGAVPVADRDRRWVETFTLANLAFRALPRQAFQDLVRLRRAHAEEDDLPAFARFWGRAERALDGQVLTAHGYEPAIAERPADQVWREVADVCSAVRERGLEVYLCAGTLLGLVRDGAPIPYDYDADVTVLLPGPTADAAAEQFWRFKERLAADGLLSTAYERKERHHARIISDSGLPVDLFPGWVDDDGRLRAWPYSAGTVRAAEVLPLERETVTGHDLPVPRVPDAVLAANYGADWRHPDPVFRFDWLTAREALADWVAASAERRGRSPLRDVPPGEA